LFQCNHDASFTGRIPKPKEHNPRTNIATTLATINSDPVTFTLNAMVLSLVRESL
jgi:hypothetical protein